MCEDVVDNRFFRKLHLTKEYTVVVNVNGED